MTSRGDEQKEIFKSRRDREKFCAYLGSASRRYGAIIHSYCLMSNHYHLLLESPEGNLSQISRHINGAYTTYFNVRRKRAGMVERPEQYEWSSYNAFVSRRQTNEWLCCDLIWEMIGGTGATACKTYRVFVERNLGRTYGSPLTNVFASSLLGSPDFVSEISIRFLNEQTERCNLPGLEEFAERPAIERIHSVVEQRLAENPCPAGGYVLLSRVFRDGAGPGRGELWC